MQPWEQFQQQAVKQPWEQFPAAEPVSTGGDIAKSLAGGVERGAAALPMVIPNLVNQIAAGPQLLGRGIAEGVDKMIGVDPQPRGDLWQPFYSSEDVLKMLPQSLQPHTPQTGAGQAADLVGQLAGGIGAGKALQAAEPGAVKLMASETSGGQPNPNTLKGEDIRALASKAYADADAKGAGLAPSAVDKFINNAAVITPQTPAGRAVFNGKSLSNDIIQNLQAGVKGKPLTLAEAQEIDTKLGDLIHGESDALTGKLSNEGRNLLQIQKALRETVQTAQPSDITGDPTAFDSWNQGRQLWAASSKAGDIERIINNAQLTDNPSTAIRTGFRNILKSGSKLNGYTDEEVAAIKKAADTGIIGGALKFMGSRIISSLAGAAGGAASGTMGAGPVGGALGGLVGGATGAVVGTPFRNAANALQTGRANAVLDAISSRAAIQQASGAPAAVKLPQQSLMAPESVALLANEPSTQKLLPAPTLKQIMQMPPAQARALLNRK